MVAKKVAIIVGPVGSMTAGYRTRADQVAAAATAAGATVVKAYSPTATWARVRAAVNGANVIVYFGHGNGYPNPYSSTENRDRVNGWGLNRTETGGDVDNWGTTMVYCGEKALLGTLTAADGAAQWSYCGGKTNTDRITPAPGFTMVYGQAHYAPGFGERYDKSDPLTTLAEAQARVRHYSYPSPGPRRPRVLRDRLRRCRRHRAPRADQAGRHLRPDLPRRRGLQPVDVQRDARTPDVDRCPGVGPAHGRRLAALRSARLLVRLRRQSQRGPERHHRTANPHLPAVAELPSTR